MRARKVVTRSGKRIRGKFPSVKLGRMVHWESLYERDAILHLEYHPLVVSYQEQPSVETYYDPAGKAHRYFPDLSALFVHGMELFYEVKPEAFLKQRKVREKLNAVATRFEELGRHYRVLTEKDIRREPLLSNLKAIHESAKKASHKETDQQLTSKLVAGPIWKLRELVLQLGSVNNVLRLIRANCLRADLETVLTDDAPVWLASITGEGHGSFRI